LFFLFFLLLFFQIFTDMKGFTRFSSTVTPSELVVFLNDMYQRFDNISEEYNIFKVEIIGDAYFGVSGAPNPCEDHADKIARAALAFIDSVEQMKVDTPALKKADVNVRIGCHSGAVVAGVVGVKDPRYHLFGKNVSEAERMESSGVPGRIQCSDAFAKEVKDLPVKQYTLVARERVEGARDQTWFIERNAGYVAERKEGKEGKEGGGGNDPPPSANGMALKAWDEKETKQKIGTEKLGIGRSVTYPSRSKSTNSVALAAWDEDK
jgi:class 3 adenylate cyclase